MIPSDFIHDAVDDAIGRAGTAPASRLPIPNDYVRWTRRIVGSRAFISSLHAWDDEEPRGVGGRKRKVPFEAVIVALLLAARLKRPLLMTELTYILYSQISDEMRLELGITDGEPTTEMEWAARYKNVRMAFHRMLWLMDPSPNPKNRRLDANAIVDAVSQHEQGEATASREVRHARLSWFTNELLEASFQQMPRAMRRAWKGSICVDATKVDAFARPPRTTRNKNKKLRRLMTSSADPDAAFYVRTRDSGYDDDPDDDTKSKSTYAHEATLVTIGPASPDEVGRFPSLAISMAVLHKPSTSPAGHALEAIRSIVDRGHPTDFAAGDRAYSNSVGDDYHLPLRALGYKLVFDYKTADLGKQAEVRGFIVVEGGLYSPSMPEALINATKDFRERRIGVALYLERLEARERYGMRVKQGADDEGHIRGYCQAAGASPTARCPLKPASKDKASTRTKRIVVNDELRINPPECCSQQSVTIAPEDAAKFRQDLPYATPEWQNVYSPLRNAIESFNGFIKDSADEDLAGAQRRRVHGTAAQSVFVAVLVFAANLRKIDSFVAKAETGADGELHKRPRRRKTAPITAWMAPGLPLTRGPTPQAAA